MADAVDQWDLAVSFAKVYGKSFSPLDAASIISNMYYIKHQLLLAQLAQY